MTDHEPPTPESSRLPGNTAPERQAAARTQWRQAWVALEIEQRQAQSQLEERTTTPCAAARWPWLRWLRGFGVGKPSTSRRRR